MKKTIYLLIVIGFFTSCSAHRNMISNHTARQNNRQIQRDNSNGDYIPLTSVQYINRYKDIAVQEMSTYGIPASITLAQGLYESGSGNSELARVANNHFGIKASPSWTGKVYYRDDDNRNDAFRVYSTAEESFRDHSLFLKKKNYAALYQLDITDYKGWANGLKRAGYATNPAYASYIINIIEKYNLQQYDGPSKTSPAATPDSVANARPTPLTVAPTDTIATASAAASKSYTVKQGDTLYNISKRFGLSVDDIKSLNNLSDNTIHIGQVLTVAK